LPPTTVSDAVADATHGGSCGTASQLPSRSLIGSGSSDDLKGGPGDGVQVGRRSPQPLRRVGPGDVGLAGDLVGDTSERAVDAEQSRASPRISRAQSRSVDAVEQGIDSPTVEEWPPDRPYERIPR